MGMSRPAPDRPNIDDLVRMEIAEDGTHATLTLFDSLERHVILALPVERLIALVATLPRHQSAEIGGDALIVRSWKLASDASGSGVRLSLETPDGRTATFRVTADAVAGLGRSRARDPRSHFSH